MFGKLITDSVLIFFFFLSFFFSPVIDRLSHATFCVPFTIFFSCVPFFPFFLSFLYCFDWGKKIVAQKNLEAEFSRQWRNKWRLLNSWKTNRYEAREKEWEGEGKNGNVITLGKVKHRQNGTRATGQVTAAREAQIANGQESAEADKRLRWG